MGLFKRLGVVIVFVVGLGLLSSMALRVSRAGPSSPFPKAEDMSTAADQADLVVIKSASSPTATLFTPFTYTVVVRNLGPMPVTTAVFTESYSPPANITFKPSRNVCTLVDVPSEGRQEARCAVGGLDVNGTFRVVAEISPIQVGQHTTVATATSELSDQIPSNNVDSISVVVQDVPIAGLVAQSSSPTSLGQRTYFTASISSRSQTVHYSWDFGDGGSEPGRTVHHTYSMAGTYTASVAASNDVGQKHVETQVVVTAPGLVLYLPRVYR